MAIRIGSSCVTGTTKPTIYDKVAEVRHVVERNDFWDNIDFCLANNIYIIANLDNWSPTIGQIYYDNNENGYRQRVDAVVDGLLQRDPTATKWRITIDNEPMKTLTRERYAWLVNVAYDQVKIRRGWRHVKIGAGNEEFSLAHARGNMLEYICQNANFDILDTHWQAAISTRDYRLNQVALDHWTNFANHLKSTYNKPLSCTEANWFDVATEGGYTDLLKVLIRVESLGIEDFPIVFMQREYNKENPYTWLCFSYAGKVRSDYWQDWLRIINEKAPIKEEDLILEKYYSRGRTYRRDVKRAGVRFIQTVIGETPDSLWGTLTDVAVRTYQQEHKLLVDGIVGPQTFRDMMKNFPDAYIDLQYYVGIGDW